MSANALAAITNISEGITAVASIAQPIMQYRQQSSQADMYKQLLNAQVARQQDDIRRSYARLKGTQKSAYAASNILLESDAVVNTLGETAYQQGLDAASLSLQANVRLAGINAQMADARNSAFFSSATNLLSGVPTIAKGFKSATGMFSNFTKPNYSSFDFYRLNSMAKL